MFRLVNVVVMTVFIASCQASGGENCKLSGDCKLGLVCQQQRCRSVANLRRHDLLQRALIGQSSLTKKKLPDPCLAPFECLLKCPTGATKEMQRQADQGWIVSCMLDDERWHGPFHRWYGNGNKRAAGAYWQGKRSGDWRHWHRNGERRALGAYEDSKRAGHWQSWHKNGKPSERGKYIKGKRSGLFHLWSEDSGKHRKVKFRTRNSGD
jgi:hypothetical protein